MARYIDADKLTDKLEELQFNAPVMVPVMKIYNVIELVEDTPTADVEEVVRCRECKYFKTFKGLGSWCHRRIRSGIEYKTKPYDFCSYGERKKKP